VALRRQHKVAFTLNTWSACKLVCCCCGAQACAEGSDSVKAAMTPRDRFTGALISPVCVIQHAQGHASVSMRTHLRATITPVPCVK
jgi:hypothetical protein